jgi:hypothetical protein
MGEPAEAVSILGYRGLCFRFMNLLTNNRFAKNVCFVLSQWPYLTSAVSSYKVMNSLQEKWSEKVDNILISYIF